MDPDSAIHAAMLHFWSQGFEGTDVAGIASAIGATKPSLYGLFGDKQRLFMRALEHYGNTIGAAPLNAFLSERSAFDAVSAFLRTAAQGHSMPGHPRGCMLACVAAQRAEIDGDVRDFYRKALDGAASTIAARFSAAVATGEFRSDFPIAQRAVLVVDLMQALALRARSGMPPEELMALADLYAKLVTDAHVASTHLSHSENPTC